jgi:RNA polymerase sigma-70 factor (ECF subfamily)
MEEEKLIKMIHSGDAQAYIHVIEKYNKLLWVIVGGILNNVGTSEDIEECISDTYLSLWRNPKMFDIRRGTLKTFLAVVAKSKALDRYRKLKKIVIVELDEAISSSDDDLFEHIARQELYSELYEAIRTLDEPNKEILIRRYFFNEKPSGIADKTHLPLREVENRLYQSKQKLRRILCEGDYVL